MRSTTLLKKRLWNRYFRVNFAKFLRALLFIEYLQWLLLNMVNLIMMFQISQVSEAYFFQIPEPLFFILLWNLFLKTGSQIPSPQRNIYLSQLHIKNLFALQIYRLYKLSILQIFVRWCKRISNTNKNYIKKKHNNNNKATS